MTESLSFLVSSGRAASSEVRPRLRRWVRRGALVALLVSAWTTSLAQPRKAPSDFSSCQQRFRLAPDDWRSAFCFAAVAGRGRYQEGERLLKELNARDPRNPGVLYALASVETILNRSAAELHFREAAELFASGGNSMLQLYCYIGLSRALGPRGRWDEVDVLLTKAEKLSKELGNPFVDAQIVMEKARLLHKRGIALSRAYHMLERVEGAVFKSTSSSIRDEFLELRGNIAYDLARYEDALRDRQTLFETTTNLRNKAAARYNQALSELALFPRPGARERGEALLREALPLAERSQNLSIMTRIHLTLGHLESGAQREWHFREAIRIAEMARDLSELSIAQQDLSLWQAESDPVSAEATMERALANAHDSRDRSVLIRGYYYRMKLSWQIHPPEWAWRDSQTALDVIEGLRNLQESAEGRLGVFSRRHQDYAWLYGKLLVTDPLSRDFQERAFVLAERGRARVLWESLGGSQPQSKTGLAGPGLTTSSVLDTIAATRKAALDPSLSSQKRDQLSEELRRLEEDWGSAERLNQFGDGNGAPPPDLVSLARVQSTLAPEEAMLSYRIAPWKSFDGYFSGGAWLMSITRESVRVYPLPEMAELETKIAVLRDLLVQRDSPDSAGIAAAALYRDLLAPALAELPKGISRLLVLPDQALHLLPFASLRAAPQAEPLVNDFRVSLVPSATLWHKWRSHRVLPNDSGALILADPETPQPLGAIKWETGGGEPERIPRLPYSAWEGREIVHLLGNRKGCLRLGSEASESFLKSLDLSPYSVLHFAAHAFIDDDRGLHSSIALTPGSGGENGLLSAPEISQLDLSGKVVTLSSCNTAVGAVFRGEGVMSLARAFFSAGSPAVVGSLWKLRDDDAALLFTTLYAHLIQGLTVDEALSTTQRELAAAGLPESAWSCAIVLGDGTATPFPRPSRIRPLIALLLGLVLLAWSALRLRRLSAS